ncbi:MAG TPA: DHA2 family efflux MFS transporter permease subunit [Thermoanaerobaculia bacterium]
MSDSTSGRWILAATILGSAMAFIDMTVVNVALPVLQTSLNTSVAGAQWIVEAYALALSSLVLVGGTLADRYGRRRTFTIGAVVFAAASLACALAPGIAWIVAARGLQGIGAALLLPSSLALLGAAFPARSRGRAVGTWSALTTVASGSGPLLGGWLVQAVSWRAVFFLNLPFAAAVLLITLQRVPESRNSSASRLDWSGALLVTLGLGALVYGLIEAPTAGWGDPRVWGPVAAGAAALAAFVAVERRSRDPMVSPELFRVRTFTAANLLTLFLYAALSGVLFFLPFALIQARGYSAAEAGAAILPLVVLISLLSPVAGRFADRVGPRLPLTVGPLVASAGFVLLALARSGSPYAVSVLPGLSVLGLGMAIVVAPLTAAVLNAAGAKRSGAASGINNAVARVAGLLAIAVFGIAATAAFNRALERGLDAAAVPAPLRQALAPERSKLGAMKPPAGASESEARAISSAIRSALDAGFRVAALSSAALALLASACAAWGVRNPKKG